ncbi:hypothetical protein AFI02nite_41820 [Aliivibrio fischeri]|uniref:Uncharacterized protein n=1 Tax=Aliivibrio fischeri TaxID=668 RepID=A0A510UNV0_ALIFS|nr:hypothetical protein AFI02nite_41820 [Aliivibrio fischeri]
MSSDLAARCIEVHTTIQSAIKDILGIDSEITIGDIHWPELSMSIVIVKHHITALLVN